MYLSPGKFFRNQILLDYLGRWCNQSCQIFFQSVHSGVSGKGSNFAIFSANRRWPLQLLYYRTTVIRTIISSTLKWDDQVASICSKTASRLHFLKIMRRACINQSDAICFYTTVIRLVLEYACTHVQSVLRSAARLILGKRKFDPISDDLRQRLHWLPVKQRIQYKLGLLVYRYLHGLTPPYLSSMLTPVSSNQYNGRLRSAARGDLSVPRTRSGPSDHVRAWKFIFNVISSVPLVLISSGWYYLHHHHQFKVNFLPRLIKGIDGCLSTALGEQLTFNNMLGSPV